MREIKFRGKRVDNGEWIYGGYHKHVKRQINPVGDVLSDDDISHLIIQSGFADWNMPRPLQAIEVVPGTVGQYTGLEDKNGKEIYEGDIIKYHYDNGIYEYINAKVIFDTGRFMLRANESGFSLTRNIYISQSSKCEVIGNIYENKELVEVNNEQR